MVINHGQTIHRNMGAYLGIDKFVGNHQENTGKLLNLVLIADPLVTVCRALTTAVAF